MQARHDGGSLQLMAPNRYVKNQVQVAYLERIHELLDQLGDPVNPVEVSLDIGMDEEPESVPLRADGSGGLHIQPAHELNSEFTFASFVEGKSNELAKAAASQVAENAGRSYNPLLLYGGVGLGKTHLMHAVGNYVRVNNPEAKVVYLHSQRFVQDMVKALQQGTMQDFMQYYRSVDTLLIDDIQFFAKKLRSQEEFFHVFNGLLERGHQMVLTCDRYPREIDGLEERLKSRFVWGLTVQVEPPELETRVAILMKKAEAEQVHLDPAVAFFIGERIRSNVRELEGALRRVIANARFTVRLPKGTSSRGWASREATAETAASAPSAAMRGARAAMASAITRRILCGIPWVLSSSKGTGSCKRRTGRGRRRHGISKIGLIGLDREGGYHASTSSK